MSDTLDSAHLEMSLRPRGFFSNTYGVLSGETGIGKLRLTPWLWRESANFYADGAHYVFGRTDRTRGFALEGSTGVAGRAYILSLRPFALTLDLGSRQLIVRSSTRAELSFDISQGERTVGRLYNTGPSSRHFRLVLEVPCSASEGAFLFWIALLIRDTTRHDYSLG
jgi:hypothetical protein